MNEVTETSLTGNSAVFLRCSANTRDRVTGESSSIQPSHPQTRRLPRGNLGKRASDAYGLPSDMPAHLQSIAKAHQRGVQDIQKIYAPPSSLTVHNRPDYKLTKSPHVSSAFTSKLYPGAQMAAFAQDTYNAEYPEDKAPAVECSQQAVLGNGKPDEKLASIVTVGGSTRNHEPRTSLVEETISTIAHAKTAPANGAKAPAQSAKATGGQNLSRTPATVKYPDEIPGSIWTGSPKTKKENNRRNNNTQKPQGGLKKLRSKLRALAPPKQSYVAVDREKRIVPDNANPATIYRMLVFPSDAWLYQNVINWLEIKPAEAPFPARAQRAARKHLEPRVCGHILDILLENHVLHDLSIEELTLSPRWKEAKVEVGWYNDFECNPMFSATAASTSKEEAVDKAKAEVLENLVNAGLDLQKGIHEVPRYIDIPTFQSGGTIPGSLRFMLELSAAERQEEKEFWKKERNRRKLNAAEKEKGNRIVDGGWDTVPPETSFGKQWLATRREQIRW